MEGARGLAGVATGRREMLGLGEQDQEKDQQSAKSEDVIKADDRFGTRGIPQVGTEKGMEYLLHGCFV